MTAAQSVSVRDRTRNVWSARRLAGAGVAWTARGAIEYAVVASTGAGATAWWLARMVPFFVALAVLWTLLTPAIAAWMRFVDTRARWPGVGLASAVVGVCAAGALDAATRHAVILLSGGSPPVPYWATWLWYLDLTAAQYFAVVLATRVLQAHDALVARTRVENKLRAQLARTRLTYLEAQLQPHFLFNALGAVTELAYEAPDAAARMLRQLAALLRSALERRGEEVTLQEELATLAPYLEIQRMRFADWLRIDQFVSADANNTLVPRLVLQPLVENALKHGLVGRSSKGQIKIVGHVEDGRLRVSVRDNGVGLRSTGESSGYGIGLRNVRDRLATLYGDDWRLALDALPSGGTSVELSIPARRAGEVPSEEPSGITGQYPVPGAASYGSAVPAGGRVLEWVRQHPAAGAAFGWFLWGSAWAGQSRAYLALRGRVDEASLSRLFVSHFTGTVLWLLATPLVVWLARRLPLERPRLAWRVAAHLALATTLAISLCYVWYLVLRAFLPGGVPLWPDDYVTSIMVGVLAYAIVLGVGHYRSAMAWMRERESTASALRAELEESRLRAATSRAQPDALVRTLERLADRVTHDVRGTERALAELADGLRASLDRGRASPGIDTAPNGTPARLGVG